MKNIIFKDFITREEVRKNRMKIYVFGDNLQKIGYGGQAKAMRGEYNTIGIPMQQAPYHYFSDDDYIKVVPIIEAYFGLIKSHLECGQTVVIPSAGVGTGLSQLSKKAPKIWNFVKNKLEELGWKNK